MFSLPKIKEKIKKFSIFEKATKRKKMNEHSGRPASDDPTFLYLANNLSFATQNSSPHESDKYLSRSTAEEEGVLFSGWLIKKGAIFRTWRKRFFRLTNGGKILYFREEKDPTEAGSIDFVVIKKVELIPINDTGMDGYCFEIKTSFRNYLFIAEDENQRTQWIRAIKLVMQVLRDSNDGNYPSHSMSVPLTRTRFAELMNREEAIQLEQSYDATGYLEKYLQQQQQQQRGIQNGQPHSVGPFVPSVSLPSSASNIESSISLLQSPIPTVSKPFHFGFERSPQESQESLHKKTIQIKGFIHCINYCLSSYFHSSLSSLDNSLSAVMRSNWEVSELTRDFSDGVRLLYLVQSLAGNRCSLLQSFASDDANSVSRSYSLQPANNLQKIQNINYALKMARECLDDSNVSRIESGFPTIPVQAILNGNLKSILDLIWALFFGFLIAKKSYQNKQGADALIFWFQESIQMITESNLSISSSSSSSSSSNNDINAFQSDFLLRFQDGFSLCALVFRYFPKFPFHSLQSYKKRENLKLAIDTIAQIWGVPALFDVDDILLNPDELVCITYLALCFSRMQSSSM